MSRYALIAKAPAPRIVRNVCEWDGDLTKWQPPSDCDAIISAVAGVGDTYDGSSFTPAPTTAAELQYRQDMTTLKQFYQAANGSATDTQRDAVLKAFMRVVKREIADG